MSNLRFFLVPTLILLVAGCSSSEITLRPARELFSPKEMLKWRVAAGYEKSKSWTLQAGEFWGHGGVVGYEDVFSNFVLEFEFLFTGEAKGGIAIRGDRTAQPVWDSGYKLEIDWADDRKAGQIRIPAKPEIDAGKARFKLGRWRTVKVEAVGSRITVYFGRKKVLEFEDDEFAKGQICLQGEKDGVRYRNLKITLLD